MVYHIVLICKDVENIGAPEFILLLGFFFSKPTFIALHIVCRCDEIVLILQL